MCFGLRLEGRRGTGCLLFFFCCLCLSNLEQSRPTLSTVIVCLNVLSPVKVHKYTLWKTSLSSWFPSSSISPHSKFWSCSNEVLSCSPHQCFHSLESVKQGRVFLGPSALLDISLLLFFVPTCPCRNLSSLCGLRRSYRSVNARTVVSILISLSYHIFIRGIFF